MLHKLFLITSSVGPVPLFDYERYGAWIQERRRKLKTTLFVFSLLPPAISPRPTATNLLIVIRQSKKLKVLVSSCKGKMQYVRYLKSDCGSYCESLISF